MQLRRFLDQTCREPLAELAAVTESKHWPEDGAHSTSASLALLA